MFSKVCDSGHERSSGVAIFCWVVDKDVKYYLPKIWEEKLSFCSKDRGLQTSPWTDRERSNLWRHVCTHLHDWHMIPTLLLAEALKSKRIMSNPCVCETERMLTFSVHNVCCKLEFFSHHQTFKDHIEWADDTKRPTNPQWCRFSQILSHMLHLSQICHSKDAVTKLGRFSVSTSLKSNS